MPLSELENMLIYHRTNIMESRAQTVVNTVNCVGVMGKGIAAEFKERFPSMFGLYKRICDEGLLEPGKLWLWKGPSQWVLNFPTKKHWRHPSKLEWIEAGLEKFVSEYETRGIREISFPRLGCGNGNLDWADVKPIMERYLGRLPIAVYIHDFEKDVGIPEHLEASTVGLSSEFAFDGSFDGFKRQVDMLVAIAGTKLVDFKTGKAFQASSDEAGLHISDGSHSALLADEDLFGTWVGLLSGLLTQDKLGWSEGEDATRALSLVGLLPYARPIEIERSRGDGPELAIQLLKPSGSVEIDNRLL